MYVWGEYVHESGRRRVESSKSRDIHVVLPNSTGRLAAAHAMRGM